MEAIRFAAGGAAAGGPGRGRSRCPLPGPRAEPLPAGPRANCDNRRVSIVPGPGRGGLITHPEKVYFAERGETKGDLAEHYARVAEPLMRAMGGRPVLLQRFPDGAGGPSFFQKRVPKNVPGWLQTTIGVHAQRHHLAGADRRRPGSRAVGGEPGLPGLPRLAVPGRRPGPRRRAADRPRPEPGRGVQPDPPGRPRAGAAARRDRDDRIPQDDRQPRPARLRPAAAALGFLPGPQRRRRHRPRAGAAQARPDHRRVVEGGARLAGVHRLQPERTAQDGLRRLVGPGPARRAGLHPAGPGRSSTTSTRTSSRSPRCPPGWRPSATRGRP